MLKAGVKIKLWKDEPLWPLKAEGVKRGLAAFLFK